MASQGLFQKGLGMPSVVHISYSWNPSCTWQCRLLVYLSTLIGLSPHRTCTVAMSWTLLSQALRNVDAPAPEPAHVWEDVHEAKPAGGARDPRRGHVSPEGVPITYRTIAFPRLRGHTVAISFSRVPQLPFVASLCRRVLCHYRGFRTRGAPLNKVLIEKGLESEQVRPDAAEHTQPRTIPCCGWANPGRPN